MLSKLPQEFRKFARNCSQLRHILRDTQNALDEITSANIFPGEDIKEQVFTTSILEKIHHILSCDPTIIVLGQSCQAKATLINVILGENLLPTSGEDSWRWIRIYYGLTSALSVTLGLNFEGGENAVIHDKTCTTLSEDDLKRPENENFSVDHASVLNVQIPHSLLRDNVQLLIPPNHDAEDTASFREIFHKGLAQVLPVLMFALGEDPLSDENIEDLRELKETYPELPIYFVCTSVTLPSITSPELKITGKCQENSKVEHCNITDRCLLGAVHQLASLGYLHLEESEERNVTTKSQSGQFPVESILIENIHKLEHLLIFIRGCLQSYLVQAANILNDIQSQCLRRFILSAFDMAREIQITPRRIQYVVEKEAELYKNLTVIASEKQEEIRRLIHVTLQEMKSGLVEKAANYRYHGVSLSENEEVKSPQEVRVATSEINYLVLSRLSNAIAAQLVESVDCLHETYVGTLQRCLESLEKNCYEQEGNLLASDAVKQILSAAYSVELTTSTSSSLLQSFLERLRKLLHAFQLPWTPPPRLDACWRKRVATQMLDSLSANRLARSICTQFRDRVRASHEAFGAALQALESHYSGHLERTEEQRVSIRKYHAPKLARLALESTSLSDMVRYGMPVLGKEIGRGQYGVVFSCESWGGSGPCAVKSVVPPDDKHWNDLAMEFYYTRTIAEHKHIVRLRGSVVDNSYGGGCTPSVLLVMDRLSRDLYCGLRSGLDWLIRLQIAIDVIEGIRYLHSQGLVHRDIKLKNVLLNSDNKAKLTDLGFCIPEAMMSGSIVGTPVHMAPELLSGHYDSSVDVYAFGILFWYVCAGHVRLPYSFEQFQNKEQLWTSVRKGLRPEKLPYFDEQCWRLMDQCWAGEPTQRPLLGYVLPQLESIRSYYAHKASTK